MNKIQNCTAIILSGGAGKRFDGRDKGLQLYRQRPLISWVIDTLEPQVRDICLSVNRNLERYQRFNLMTVSDNPDHSNTAFQGPVAGILACWKHRPLDTGDRLLIASCDSPGLPNDYVAKLENGLQTSRADVAVVHDGTRRQNLHCLIKPAVLPSLQSFYDNGGRAMHRWFDEIKLKEVDFSDQAAAFSNLNTPAHLDEPD